MPSSSRVGALAVSCSVELTVNRLSPVGKTGSGFTGLRTSRSLLHSSSVSRVGGRETCDELNKRMMHSPVPGLCRLETLSVCRKTPLVCS